MRTAKTIMFNCELVQRQWLADLVYSTGLTVDISGGVIDKLYVYSLCIMKDIIRKMLIYTSFVETNKVTTKFVQSSLDFMTSAFNISDKVISYIPNTDKSRQAKIRRMCFYKKHSNKLIININVFASIVFHISDEIDHFKTNVRRYTKNALVYLQHYIEDDVRRYIQNYLDGSNFNVDNFVRMSIIYGRSQIQLPFVMNEYFFSGIRNVLTQLHPNTNITLCAITQINYIVGYTIMLISMRCKFIAEQFKSDSKIDSRVVRTAVELMLHGELAKHALCEGRKSVVNFSNWYDNSQTSQENTDSVMRTRSRDAKCLFNVRIVDDIMKRYVGKSKVSITSTVYLCGVCEYLTAEILELAGNCAKDQRAQKITPSHIDFAIHNDAELCQWFSKVGIQIIGTGYNSSRENILCRYIENNELYEMRDDVYEIHDWVNARIVTEPEDNEEEVDNDIRFVECSEDECDSDDCELPSLYKTNEMRITEAEAQFNNAFMEAQAGIDELDEDIDENLIKEEKDFLAKLEEYNVINEQTIEYKLRRYIDAQVAKRVDAALSQLYLKK